jgi:hypothetical protein
MSYSWGVGMNSGDRTFVEATRFIAAQDGGTQRLLEVHHPDEHRRCRGCGIAGTDTPHVQWPCSLAHLAQAAQPRS